MFGWAKRQPNALEQTIQELHSDMKGVDPETKPEIYKGMRKELERLYALQEQERKRRVSPDVLITVAGNLAVVLIIVYFERGAVMVSKAKDYVVRPR